MNKTEKKLILIAIVFLITLLLSLWGFDYLKGKKIFSRNTYYYVIYPNVDGLMIGAPVYLNGFQIGQVYKMKFINDQRKILVTLLLNYPVKINKGSVAQIFSTDLLSSKAIRILLNYNSSVYLKPHDTLANSIQPDLADVLSKQSLNLNNAVKQLLNIIAQINSVFSDSSVSALKKSIVYIQQISANLNSYLQKNSSLDNTLKNLDSITLALKNKSAQINAIIDNTKSFTDSLSQIRLSQYLNGLQALLNDLDSVALQLKQGKGTVGKLLVYDSLYNKLDSSIETINRILKNYQKHPFKLIDVSVFHFKSKN